MSQEISISKHVKGDSPLIKKSETILLIFKWLQARSINNRATWGPSILGTWLGGGVAHCSSVLKSQNACWPPSLEIKLVCSLLVTNNHWQLFWNCLVGSSTILLLLVALTRENLLIFSWNHPKQTKCGHWICRQRPQLSCILHNVSESVWEGDIEKGKTGPKEMGK